MPGNLQPANPTEVMPKGLCTAFQEELRFESFVNSGYPDGSSDRVALALNARHFFRFTRRATATQYAALFTFYKAHLIVPFYFYNLRESNFVWDATGGSTVGRYTVVFDGNWSDQSGLGRSQASLGLREVA